MLEQSLADKERELIQQSEIELEKEKQALSLNQNTSKKLIDTEAKFIKCEIENQKLLSRLEELKETIDSIEKDKVKII